jgi:hypothetical protein
MATAKAFGVSKILAFDVLESRVAFARSMWADYAAISPSREEGEEYGDWAARFKTEALKAAGVDPWGVDVVVEAAGAEAAMHAGMTFVHSGGTCEWIISRLLSSLAMSLVFCPGPQPRVFLLHISLIPSPHTHATNPTILIKSLPSNLRSEY